MSVFAPRRAGHPFGVIQLSAAERVQRVEDAYTNWYVVEDGNGLTVSGAATANSEQTLGSLDALVATVRRRC